ncbi:MAG: cupin domain-containing protein [Clostridia bacterium]|nr:cupin domain-containing protein [Clostridia bacterium]
MRHHHTSPKDYGNIPCVLNIDSLALQNQDFLRTLWTGTYLQVTLMNLNPGERIGFEQHKDTDQLIKVVSGTGTVYMGNDPRRLTLRTGVDRRSVILIPAGTYHDVKNNGREPLKLVSVYAPPHHPFGKTQETPDTEETASPSSSADSCPARSEPEEETPPSCPVCNQ